MSQDQPTEQQPEETLAPSLQQRAVRLDDFLEQMRKDPEFAKEAVPVVITFCLAALGIAGNPATVLTATPVFAGSEDPSARSFILQQHLNFPSRSDEEKLMFDHLNLSFAEFIQKKYATEEVPTSEQFEAIPPGDPTPA